MSASESPLYPAALVWSQAACLRVRARPTFLVNAGGRSDVFNALTCLESTNLVITLTGVSTMLFASGGVWSFLSCYHPRVLVNQDMKLGKVTR